MPGLAPGNDDGDTERGASESGKSKPGEHHPIPDDLERLSGTDDSDYLLLRRDRDCNDQLTTELTVGDGASGGQLHDGVAAFGPATKPQPQAAVVNANLSVTLAR
jgi:hypothetical protein